MTVDSLVGSAAGSAHPVIISRRRRPADRRPAACRIILIRDSGGDADGVIGERAQMGKGKKRCARALSAAPRGFRCRLVHSTLAEFNQTLVIFGPIYMTFKCFCCGGAGHSK